MMRECVMGIVLYYHFADDGFVFRVRVHELFADEMPTIIRVLTILHGQPVILDTRINPETNVSKSTERRFWKAAS